MTSDHHSYKKATTKLQIVSHLDWWCSSHLVRHWGKWIECRLIQTFPLLEHTRQSFRRVGRNHAGAPQTVCVWSAIILYIYFLHSLVSSQSYCLSGGILLVRVFMLHRKNPLNQSKAGIIWTINLTLAKLAKYRDIWCGMLNFWLVVDQSIL